MLRSIRGFVSAELGALAPAPASTLPSRSTFAAVLGYPAGRVGLALTGLVLVMALFAPLLTSLDPFALTGASLLPPSPSHPMGTDALGRDLFSGVVYGARTSLIVAASVSALAFICGAGVGLLAGFRGGVVDDILMRITELLQVLPRFFLAIVAIALFGPGLDRIVLTLGLTSWPVLARVVRADVLSLRHIEFVRAAEASGASSWRILVRQLLPNVLPSAIALVGLLFGQVLLLEASLGFLGLGDPNAMSWGLLAGQAQGFLRVAWWLSFFPGLAITVAVLAVNLIADALAAAFGAARRSGVQPASGNSMKS